MSRRFSQVDVFGSGPCSGNPVAVVRDAEGMSDEEMRRFARWTNLAETTFVLPPTRAEADYRVRIFTPVLELPFAGHPTLGTCHAWLEAGGEARGEGEIVQECEAGLIRVRREGERLAFEAPPLVRSGPASEEDAAKVAAALDVDPGEMLAVEWVDNGPGWIAALFESAERVLELRPGALDFDLGAVGFHPPGSPAAIELRAWAPVNGLAAEDPVTGSLNASVAQWLLASGRLEAPYLAHQGTAIDRAGRIHVSQDEAGAIWIGGATVTVIAGSLAKPQ
ncbi:MAG TPA: PhzF family phenazine biosynthesis protein [Solirubrobacterales bacterium]|jgi:PhzF family phenazine biosynthesis protein|nr:PhzF family phenazine biosynthesis protein [Solirubrobacterales bacterium]